MAALSPRKNKRGKHPTSASNPKSSPRRRILRPISVQPQSLAQMPDSLSGQGSSEEQSTTVPLPQSPQQRQRQHQYT